MKDKFKIIEIGDGIWEVYHNERLVINQFYKGVVSARERVLEIVDIQGIGEFQIEVATYIQPPFKEKEA
jgi:hypothetical protein